MGSDMSGDAGSILDFWFREIGADHWWTRSDATDETIRTRFLHSGKSGATFQLKAS